jgi:hypothetical protein
MMHDRPKGRTLGRARLFWDFSLPRMKRAYLDCPATAMLREVRKIEFADGGCLDFPSDSRVFHDKALPNMPRSVAEA